MTQSSSGTELLAVEGGTPVRSTLLPYGRQSISESDVTAVLNTLRSAWLTTGPLVNEFERAFAEMVGARHAVAVANGTAALHAAMRGIGIGPGDEVIVPAITFAATANAVLYVGGRPVFADIDPDTLLIAPQAVAAAITSATRAIVAVDYAGQPCDYDDLRSIADGNGIAICADACHALGATYRDRMVGTLGGVNTFSFHPVKPITTGEGGMITTDDARIAEHMRTFRNHGIPSDHRQRELAGSFAYDMVELGFNYRLTDLQCALGLSQLQSLQKFCEQRAAIAAFYDTALQDIPCVRRLATRADRTHARHLYVVRLDLGQLTSDRATIYRAMRAEGIGVNVHYRPVYLQPFYAGLGYQAGQCPSAEAAYERILTLPVFAGMSIDDAADVVAALRKVVARYRR